MLEIEFSTGFYESLLAQVAEAGYRFSRFEENPEGDNLFFLRHDVDKRVDRALDMARIEAAQGVHAHYFFLLHAPVYSLLETETYSMVEEIHQLGHTIGLHCDERRIPGPEPSNLHEGVLRDLDWLRSIFPFARPVVSFHNPSRRVLERAECPGYANTYGADFFPPRTKYLSDSNRHFREPDGFERLLNKEWPRVQLLVHPVWWFNPDESPLKILKDVVCARHESLDNYLRYSNNLWSEAAHSPEKST